MAISLQYEPARHKTRVYSGLMIPRAWESQITNSNVEIALDYTFANTILQATYPIIEYNGALFDIFIS